MTVGAMSNNGVWGTDISYCDYFIITGPNYAHFQGIISNVYQWLHYLSLAPLHCIQCDYNKNMKKLIHTGKIPLH